MDGGDDSRLMCSMWFSVCRQVISPTLFDLQPELLAAAIIAGYDFTWRSYPRVVH